MKALSMKQPVPELILQKKKLIETRTWRSDFLGEFYLHTSNDIIKEMIERFELDKEKLTKEAIVGKAGIIERKTCHTIEEFQKDFEKHLMSYPKKLPTYSYILENTERLKKPVPFKGKLNFFEVNL